MKLCFVSPGQWSIDILQGETASAGGAEAQLAYLAAVFAKMGHRVDFIYGNGETEALTRDIAGVRCVRAFPSWKRPGSLREFWHALWESKADLIYSRLPHDFLWLEGLFAKRSGHTTFMYALANDMQCNPWLPFASARHYFYFHNALYALGMRIADIVAVQHEAQAQKVKPFIKGRLVLIPNLARSLKTEPRRYEETTSDVIWVSHIHPRKQLSILLDIAERLPKLKFIVVGGFGPEPNRNQLEHRMHRLKNLEYKGSCQFEVVIQLLMSSKVLVNTSSWEGFPNSMLDAWSVGVPVVSLQIDPGGVIRHEGLGLVSGNLSQIILDIMKLVVERSLNCEMGSKGQNYVQRVHSLEAVSEGFEQILPGFQAPYEVTQ